MISQPLKGLGTALVTPFNEYGSLDIERVGALASRQIENGVDFLIPCGTTGETVTLTDEEYTTVLRTVVSAADGKVPVVAGAGSNSTQKTIETAKTAVDCGVDGVLIVGPYYNKPTQEGYYQHFRTVAEAVDTSIVMYNVPGRTAGNIAAETQLRIAEIDNVVATKEASGNLSQIYRIVRGKPEGFSVLSGDDNLVLAQLAIGMDGVVSVISNEMPHEFATMVHLAMDGEYETARQLHYRMLDLEEGNFMESSPIPVKTAMSMMGLLNERVRLPLVPMQTQNREALKRILVSLDLVKE